MRARGVVQDGWRLATKTAETRARGIVDCEFATRGSQPHGQLPKFVSLHIVGKRTLGLPQPAPCSLISERIHAKLGEDWRVLAEDWLNITLPSK